MNDQATNTSVKTKWNDFWKEIVTNEDGSLNLEQVKRELYDFYNVMRNVNQVYDHVTGGLISKPMTDAQVVINYADEHYAKLHEPEETELYKEE